MPEITAKFHHHSNSDSKHTDYETTVDSSRSSTLSCSIADGTSSSSSTAQDSYETNTLAVTTSTSEEAAAIEELKANRLQRHPPNIRGSIYTRFFRLERSETRSNVLVESSWVPVAWLFGIRCFLFLYAATVLITDVCMTERPKYEFCYLTQLSYLGLTAYLGTVSWHTLSEWRRERAWQQYNRRTASLDMAREEAGHPSTTNNASNKSNKSNSGRGAAVEAEHFRGAHRTTVERQFWWLTDMNFFLYHTVCTFHIIVPVIYWGYLAYSGDAHMMAVDLNTAALWRNFSFHGGDLVVVFIEISLNNLPFIPSHFAVVLFISILYLGEALLVYRVDGFWIYAFLDYTGSPIWVALYFGAGVGIACAFLFMYLVHRLRNWIRAKRGHPGYATTTAQQLAQREQYDEPQASQQQYDQNRGDIMDSGFIEELGEKFVIDTMGPAHSRAQVMNRMRSVSDCSTASTLVGCDEGMGSKGSPKKHLGSPSSVSDSPQLEKVEEVNESETEDNDANEHHHL
ncbi:hypothetical protein BGZ98_000363 [Dissophora globulifera]|nr:hypothetical protein BGZ98_000363 [Dissophora globulifera]